jgi:hypothetical protein
MRDTTSSYPLDGSQLKVTNHQARQVVSKRQVSRTSQLQNTGCHQGSPLIIELTAGTHCRRQQRR